MIRSYCSWCGGSCYSHLPEDATDADQLRATDSHFQAKHRPIPHRPSDRPGSTETSADAKGT